MALPVTVYRWDDDGAPQLNYDTRPSEYIEILKKCLVEGYGDKVPLGWSIPFESNNGLQIVFKKDDESSGGFVKFWAAGDSDSPGDSLLYRAATQIDGLDQDLEGAEGSGYQAATAGWTGVTRWILIGTKVGFYFIGSADESVPEGKMALGTYPIPSFFVGDIESFYSNDLSRFTTIVGKNDSNMSSRDSGHSLAGIDYFKQLGRMHETLGVSNPKNIEVLLPFQTYSTSKINMTPISQMVFSKVMIALVNRNVFSFDNVHMDSEGNHVTNSDLHPAIRGTVPGMLQSHFQGFSEEIWPQERDILGQKHYLMQTWHNGACGIWVNAEAWYE